MTPLQFVVLLFLVGLPFLVIGVLALVVLGIVFGLLGAVVGLGLAALKIAVFIALPLWIIAWLVGKSRGRERVKY